jgi:hypothetical protein
MHKALAALLLFFGLASAALAQQSVVVPATMASVPITVSTATTTRLVIGVSNKSIYVTAVDIIAAGTGNIQFIAGTGATCGTGTVNITGNYSLIAQVGFTKAAGNGAVWVVPQNLSLCVVTSAAVGMPGSLSYAIF